MLDLLWHARRKSPVRFDLLAFQGGPLGITRFVEHDPPWALDDYVHMTDEAHARLGEVLDRALTGAR